MTSAVDIDNRDQREMNNYHEARIEALQRENKLLKESLSEQAKELERLRDLK